MFYSLGEVFENGLSLLYTKIRWKKARLIRLPFRARNAKNIFISKGFTCGQYCRITAGDLEKKKVMFGENFVMGDMCQIEGQGGLIIGKNVLFASRVFVGTTSHGDYSSQCGQSKPEISPNDREVILGSIVIEDNVWIGNNVSILSGVTIGKGSIVGANSVVTKDVPNNCIVVGSPAHIIKRYSRESCRWEIEER